MATLLGASFFFFCLYNGKNNHYLTGGFEDQMTIKVFCAVWISIKAQGIVNMVTMTSIISFISFWYTVNYVPSILLDTFSYVIYFS